MDKRFLAIIGVILALFVGLLVFSKDKSNPSESVSTPTAHIKGPAEAKVTLIEYGDYQCPACANFNPTVDAVVEKYADKIKFQFRNLPLSQIHAHAFAAARAAEAADLQGKFWEMHDALYEANKWVQWTAQGVKDPKPFFWQYAKEIGLDVEKFKRDFTSTTVNRRINADLTEFQKTGKEQSTPSFFLNGKYIPNAQLYGPEGTPSIDAFSKLIDAELVKTQASAKQ